MYKIQYVFLDSGVGGIPYLQCLLEKEVGASSLYVADIANFPYGTKTKEEVIASSKALVEKIIEKVSPEVIIIACNTITVCALDILRAFFSTPFVGTVPAIKVATNITKNNKIGLIGTERTVSDAYIEDLLLQTGEKTVLYPKAESELVRQIENGLMFQNRKEQLKIVNPIVEYFEKKGCDVLILGCTHFLHLRDAFIEAGKKCKMEIAIADSLEGVVRQALKISPCKRTKDAKKLFYATGSQKDIEKYKKYAEMWHFTYLDEKNLL